MIRADIMDTVAKTLVLMDQERLYDGLVDPAGELVALDLSGYIWDRPANQPPEDRLLDLILKIGEPQDRLKHTIYLELPMSVVNRLTGYELDDSAIVQYWIELQGIALNKLPRLIN